MKKALITDIMMQDGNDLAQYLLWRDYEAFNPIRPESQDDERLAACLSLLQSLRGDMRDETSLKIDVGKASSGEIDHLAGRPFSPTPSKQRAETIDADACELARILQILERRTMKTHVYQASSPRRRDREASTS